MTNSEFDLFLIFSCGLCLLMALVNALRSRSRGLSSYFLSGAFVLMAGALAAYRFHVPNLVVGLLGTGVFALLVADLAYRSMQRKPLP
jgi:hypothetical protein